MLSCGNITPFPKVQLFSLPAQNRGRRDRTAFGLFSYFHICFSADTFRRDNLRVPTASHVQEFYYTSPLVDYVHLNSNEDVSCSSPAAPFQYTFSAPSWHRKEANSLEFLFGPKWKQNWTSNSHLPFLHYGVHDSSNIRALGFALVS